MLVMKINLKVTAAVMLLFHWYEETKVLTSCRREKDDETVSFLSNYSFYAS